MSDQTLLELFEAIVSAPVQVCDFVILPDWTPCDRTVAYVADASCDEGCHRQVFACKDCAEELARASGVFKCLHHEQAAARAGTWRAA